MSDPVNSPSHYKLNAEGVECIDAIKASMSPLEYQGYLKGNAMKYLWRFRYKHHPVQDLKKAQWYLVKLTEEYEKERAEAKENAIKQETERERILRLRPATLHEIVEQLFPANTPED